MDDRRWIRARVQAREDWAPGLFSMTLDVVRDFRAGQFTLLAREDPSARGGHVKRAYSIASAPGDPLEFYLVEVPGGALTPWLAKTRVGDEVWLGRRTTGRFTLDRIPDAPVLWMFATGTGLAPYLSMWREHGALDRFDRVVIVHGVREPSALAYRAELERRCGARCGYVPLCSRAEGDDFLSGRIPARLFNGSVGAWAGVPFDPTRHQVMLCGNPAMIDQMVGELGERGMTVPQPGRPGQVHLERYW